MRNIPEREDGATQRHGEVLFTDLVGSTELLSRLGETAFDSLRRSHFGTLREALARHHGDEVKTLGDGVMAVFDSASDAVSAGVDIQQAVDRASRARSMSSVTWAAWCGRRC